MVPGARTGTVNWRSRQHLTRRRLLCLSGIILLGTASSGTALARRGRGRGRDHDDEHHEEGEHHEDYERARQAVGSGEALPLSEIIVEVKKVIDGDVLDVLLQKSEAGLIYQIRLLSHTGTYHQVSVDAKTKIILKIEKQ